MTTRALSTLDEKKTKTRRPGQENKMCGHPVQWGLQCYVNITVWTEEGAIYTGAGFTGINRKYINILGSLTMTQNASPRWQHNTTTQLCGGVTSFSLYKIFTDHRSTKTTADSRLTVKPNMFWTSLVEHTLCLCYHLSILVLLTFENWRKLFFYQLTSLLCFKDSFQKTLADLGC